MLATGDDLGKVNIFKSPCVDASLKPSATSSASSKGQTSLTYSGHSSHVMNVRWSVGDEFLISCGGGDKCIFQWKHILSSLSVVPAGVVEEGEEGQEEVDESSQVVVDVSDIDLSHFEISGGDEVSYFIFCIFIG